ncbi:hypothetical protein B0H10DRAFT_2329384 [Mycena sp. CBHHK59/15]|nr:hypothetical protein B0H10DRAFT_2329384 [Mycena sp. CBHHK59/15]
MDSQSPTAVTHGDSSTTGSLEMMREQRGFAPPQSSYCSIEVSTLPRAQFHFSQAPDVDGSRFWAVIIGIDAYEDSKLNGCVNDANLIGAYLREGLGVPEERMQVLLAPAPAESDINILSPSATISSTPY